MIVELARAIDRALTNDPPKKLLEICGDYYSPYYNLFYLLAAQDKVAVELGVDQGRGCAAFMLGGCKTFGIDHTLKIGVLEMNRLGDFTFLQQSSLPVPVQVPKGIDFLHIDTEHSYSQAQAEFEGYKPYLNDGAVVFFDDLHAQKDNVLKYFMTLPYFKVVDDRLHPTCGFGFLLFEKDKE